MLSEAKVGTTLPCTDLARAKTWYAEKLDMKPVHENQWESRYECGGGTGFSLYETQYAGTAQNTACGFEVDDFDKCVQGLRDKGVKLEDLPDLGTVDGVSESDGFKICWFKDCEGNTLAVASKGTGQAN